MAAVFFAAGFLAGDYFAGDFFAVGFFAGDFFGGILNVQEPYIFCVFFYKGFSFCHVVTH